VWYNPAMPDYAQVAQQVYALYQAVLRDESRPEHAAELLNYYPRLGTLAGCCEYTRFVYDLCALARFDPTGKRVLDVGCGLGLQLVILHFMGVAEGRGFDPYADRLQVLQRVIAEHGLTNLHAAQVGLEEADYPHGAFDMILSNEAISHYPSVERFLERAAQWLRTGGVLIIADGNNGANPALAHKTRQIWERFENGPAGKFEGHTILQPYRELREAIIRECAPDLDAQIIAELARRTSGMTQPAILDAVRHYRATGEMPNARFTGETCPVNPYSGAVIERLFNPLELARQIESYGFRARAYAYFGGAKGNPLVRMANAILMALTPLSIRWANSFRIVAVRVQL
jgi:2-polyprenyl-3-methyl-5-hydroxy-6-metoxy-1,4-benzoquinol methylase